jgi:hypothetical protein
VASVEFIHFCNHAFFDSHGAPCLIGILGEIFARQFPLSVDRISVAVGLRVEAGENALVYVEIGPPNEPAKRSTPFRIEGPPADGTLSSGLSFLPFASVSLYFDRPQIVEARVTQNNVVLGSKTLPIALRAPQQTATQDEGIHLP